MNRILIVTLVALVALAPVAAAKKIGPFDVYTGDVEGNPKEEFAQGEFLYLWFQNSGADKRVYIKKIEILDPSGNTVTTAGVGEVIIPGVGKKKVFEWQIPETAPTGTYAIVLEFVDLSTGVTYTDTIYFKVVTSAVAPAPPPAETQETQQGLPLATIAVVAVVLAVVGIAAVMFLSRRKPEQLPPIIARPTTPAAPPPPPPPPASPQTTGGGETVVVPAGAGPASGGGETLTSLARLVAPNGKVIPITSTRQRFGREDFVGLVDEDKLRLISRRSRPQFEIYFDNAKKAWFIVDYGSANGTYVNGEDIRGKGPVELKNGDVISPAGVIDLVFQA